MNNQTRKSHYRWVICALLFAATTINYMDRQIFGLLKPTLMTDLQWSESVFGDIVAAFSLAYAFGYLGVGRLMDKVGVRKGLPIAVTLWSICGAIHAFMSSAFGFKIARAGLGITEGGNFPASIKTVAEWFPKKERALATGIFNAGSNVGAVVTPILVPLLVTTWGWRAAFFITGTVGIIWVVFWWALYRKPEGHPRVSPEELAYIKSDPIIEEKAREPWLKLLTHRGTWAFVVGISFANPVWWFYLNWVPGFLTKQFGLNLMTAMLPLVLIYLFADVGSVAGGWLSSYLIKRGVETLRARKWAFLACALCVVPVFMASEVHNMWLAVILIGVAASAHQGYSANLYTLVSDTMAPSAVSSVVGIGGFAGYFVGTGVSMFVGRLLDATGGNYHILFALASSMYLIGLVFMHFILPRKALADGPADNGAA